MALISRAVLLLAFWFQSLNSKACKMAILADFFIVFINR